ncbi:MAG: acyl carrier protein [Candidatus Glassbacteria bacterium RBG_16_58_8]|uniref:Acyl carrier protein n=1 Tax=Candidatus Glassbacteria bacterium RBG_16_58_8 TaxID=1817866 RepID=A0A1F5YCT0_9BACT|nr:MAG: acyl carrier protein [Candidatus Glassbacteria bacterium RBG_16_58_8]
MNTVQERLRKVLSKELKVDSSQIKENSSLADDLGVDSADMVDLLFAIEDEFKIEISDEEVEGYQVFGDIVKRIEEKIEG